MAPTGQIDPGQHHLTRSGIEVALHLGQHRGNGERTARPAPLRDDAEGAGMVAPVLHFHERPRLALDGIHRARDKMMRGLGQREQIVDARLAITRQIEERRHTAHTFAVVGAARTLDVGRHQLLGPHAGVAADQFIQRIAEGGHTRLGQPPGGHHPALLLVALDLTGVKSGHGVQCWLNWKAIVGARGHADRPAGW